MSHKISASASQRRVERKRHKAKRTEDQGMYYVTMYKHVLTGANKREDGEDGNVEEVAGHILSYDLIENIAARQHWSPASNPRCLSDHLPFPLLSSSAQFRMASDKATAYVSDFKRQGAFMHIDGFGMCFWLIIRLQRICYRPKHSQKPDALMVQTNSTIPIVMICIEGSTWISPALSYFSNRFLFVKIVDN